MKFLSNYKLFEATENNDIYILPNYDNKYYTANINDIPMLIEEVIEGTIKNIEEDKDHYLTDEKQIIYKYMEKYHPSVGWLPKSIVISKISGEFLNTTDKILYLSKSDDNIPIYDKYIKYTLNDFGPVESLINNYLDQKNIIYDIRKYELINNSYIEVILDYKKNTKVLYLVLLTNIAKLKKDKTIKTFNI